MKKILAMMLCLVLICSLSACNSDTIIVAEKGSAGETVAQENSDFADFAYIAVDTQAKALMEVKAGTADAAIIDYVMSIGSIGEGTDYADLVVEGDGYAEEEYGIAFRKGSDMTAAVNQAIRDLKADGTLTNIAKTYKLDGILLGDKESAAFEQSATDSDYAYIMEKGELVIGITYFAPMNYKDENGKLIGFETEFAEAVCAKLGVKATFQEIDWNSKELELASKNIDCIWNGMTITPEREENMSISIPYMQNKQVKVIKTDEFSVALASFVEVSKALGEGFLQNCVLFFGTLLFAIPLGLLIAFCSMSKFKPLSYVTKVFVWCIRGTPLMLQLFVVFYVPGILFDVNIPSRMFAAMIAFVINYACYFSEIYRGGIESIPKGQYEAGQVLGLTKTQIFKEIVLLQVVKRIIPPMGNEIITLVKDTSLARVIMVSEILKEAEHFSAEGVIWPLFFTAIFFLAFCGLLTLLFGYIEKKLNYFN